MVYIDFWDEALNSGRFLYYLLKGNIMEITSLGSGSVYDAINKSAIENLKIEIPPLETQRKIAAILSAYDDLIENNTRRIQILEEMAQTIYKEWFVKFRFPGHEKVKMVDSELGKIPEGWAVKKVKDIVKRLKAGRTYTQKEVLPMGNIPVVDQSRSEFLGFHNNESDHYASSEEPIILFGDHTCKMQIMVEPFSLGPNVIPFISNDNGLIYYLFFLVRNLVETREYKRHWNELVIKKVALADKKSQIPFSEMIKPMAEEINLLRKRNLNLHRTRDLLLPKLISGEVDIESIDIIVQEVTPLKPS
ncbi:restriction endonuclease subunit S [Methanophagales archaeon]|nr:MAG: restriction endonuclease subunit S [Methanophagales archaeon]